MVRPSFREHHKLYPHHFVGPQAHLLRPWLEEVALRKRVRDRLRRHRANKERKGADSKARIGINRSTGGLKQVGEIKANKAMSLKEIKESNLSLIHI